MKTGLVFAGGGGKGSYEIGVWKALRETGLDSEITAVAGTSIGAVNAVMLAMGKYDEAERLWKNIDPLDFIDLDPSTGYCDRSGIIRILNDNIDEELLRRSNVRCIVCAARKKAGGEMREDFADDISGAGKTFQGENAGDDIRREIINIRASLPGGADIGLSVRSSAAPDHDDARPESYEAEYFLLNGRPKKEIIDLILASTAMPFVYPEVIINGNVYRDGGLRDNLPEAVFSGDMYKDISGGPFERLIVVRLRSEAGAKKEGREAFRSVIDIEPSFSLGESLADGTLDFSPGYVQRRMSLGFYDAKRFIDIEDKRLTGEPYTEEQIRIMKESSIRFAESEERSLKAFDKAEKHIDGMNDMLKRYGIDI